MDINLEEIKIREFTSGDKDLVDAFFGQMGGETRALFDRDSGNHKNALKYFSGEAKNKIYFLAEHRGIMVGYIFLWDIDTMVPWLGIAVHDEYKGKRLGRKLMQFLIDYARNKGKGGLLLTTHISNIRGQGLYDRMGFERMGTYLDGEVLYLLRFKN